ncbi:MAG: glycoside hydrolase family 16 protein [Clostridia bacterium]|nr:glycoside hydrolase family 16 protein [Clostridia bacterium]
MQRVKWTPALLALLLLVGFTPAGRAESAEPAYDIGSLNYELVWADEFDTDGLPDPALWTFNVGGGGWGNGELQYYMPKGNASIENGVLTIEVRKERRGTCSYSSARMLTRNVADWLYCKIEARAKLPSGKGTWPAIWMLPTDGAYGDWPASGEIDIMEHVGFDPDVIVQSIHTARTHGDAASNHSVKVPGVREDFHTYGVEWLPDRIIFSIDGEPTYTYEKPETAEGERPSDTWPFDQRMHLLINLAFGGTWGGSMGIDEGCLPARFEVDYVRVYQSPEILALTGQ